jgi:hypothetical protein
VVPFLSLAKIPTYQDIVNDAPSYHFALQPTLLRVNFENLSKKGVPSIRINFTNPAMGKASLTIYISTIYRYPPGG